MRITEVRLTTSDLAEAADFWGRTLELPVDRGAQSLSVRIGASTLALDSTPEVAGAPGDESLRAHHVAVTIPSDRFAEGVRWLRARLPLLGRGGTDDFRISSPPWNSRSVYFRGPDGIVLELIARYALPASSTGPFTSADLLCISEIGIAAPDVTTAVQNLTETLELKAFGDSSPGFAPLGDQHGLLIVVHEDRIWFPTTNTRPSPSPVTVTMAADGEPTSLRCGATQVVRPGSVDR